MKFKPFCVKYEDWMTDGQVNSVLEKALMKGATNRVMVESLYPDNEYLFAPKEWEYFGVNHEGYTEAYNRHVYFGEDAVLITLDHVDTHLGLTKPDAVAETSVQPKSLANVKLDCRKPDGSVDEELSRAFQEACFEQGIGWGLRHTEYVVKHLSQQFLVVEEGRLTYEDGFEYFKGHNTTEIKFTYERKLVWDYEVVAKEEPAERKVVTSGGVEYYEDMIAPMFEAMQSARVSKED